LAERRLPRLYLVGVGVERVGVSVPLREVGLEGVEGCSRWDSGEHIVLMFMVVVHVMCSIGLDHCGWREGDVSFGGWCCLLLVVRSWVLGSCSELPRMTSAPDYFLICGPKLFVMHRISQSIPL
jgi:hypothetical protein